MKIPQKIPTGLVELNSLINTINEFFVLLDNEDILEEDYNKCLQTIGIISIITFYGNDGIDILKFLRNKFDK